MEKQNRPTNAVNEELFKTITSITCKKFMVDHNKIFWPSRKREIVQARQICMYFANKYTSSSLADIGWHYGRKDHATVLHAKKTVGNLYDTDRTYREKINEIDTMINHVVTNVTLKIIVCSNCGGSDVQTRVWIDPNTRIIVDGDEDYDESNCFCNDCNEHHKLILKDNPVQKVVAENDMPKNMTQTLYEVLEEISKDFK